MTWSTTASLQMYVHVCSFASAHTRAPLRLPSRHLHHAVRACALSSPPSPPVKLLPYRLIQRIAAGEVISDTLSVVRELVDNSLDAHARSLLVDVDPSTRTVVVRDDGVGMSHQSDLLLAPAQHTTSKLHSPAQLSDGSLTSLGFRGQALFAIAASCRSLSIATRPVDIALGAVQHFSADGHPSGLQTPVPMPVGTVVTAACIVPLSDKETHGPLPPAQWRAVRAWLARAALCHPCVTMRLSRAGKPVWNAVSSQNKAADHAPTFNFGDDQDENEDLKRFGDGDSDAVDQHASQLESKAVAARLASEAGVHVDHMHHATVTFPSIATRIVLVVGNPALVSMSSSRWLVSAVNGRCVRLEPVLRAITKACALGRGRFPVAFVHVQTDPRHVNWNICARKSTVRFRGDSSEDDIVRCVLRVLGDALQPVPMELGALKPTLQQTGFNAVLTSSAPMKRLLTDSFEEAEKKVRLSQATSTRHVEALSLLGGKVVSQVLNTYILLETSGGITLIEQHVADERVMYERLLECWNEHQFVRLTDPVCISGFPYAEAAFRLITLGFEVDDHAELNSYGHSEEVVRVLSVPYFLSSVSSGKLRWLLSALCSADATIEEAAATVSCGLAVRNGRPLEKKKMHGIVNGLFQCKNPHTCPHGRPIFHSLDTKALAALFKRSWLPERSISFSSSDSDGDTAADLSLKQRVFCGTVEE